MVVDREWSSKPAGGALTEKLNGSNKTDFYSYLFRRNRLIRFKKNLLNHLQLPLRPNLPIDTISIFSFHSAYFDHGIMKQFVFDTVFGKFLLTSDSSLTC